MATVYRFKVDLSGFVGGPGLNTWHMAQAGGAAGADQSDLEGMAADIRAVYVALAGNLPQTITTRLAPIVEGFDVATGQLTQVTGIAQPDAVAGTSSQTSMPRATQITVRLKTDAIRGNRLLQGRHFIGPVAGSVIGADGQVTNTVRTSVAAAYGGVLDIGGNGRLVVWGRPNPLVDGLETGVLGYVQGVLVNSVPGTLRSRKI